jgi:hypothetical protein
MGGGKESPLCAWAAKTLESFRPRLVRMQILSVDTIVMETIEDPLRTAVVEARN